MRRIAFYAGVLCAAGFLATSPLAAQNTGRFMFNVGGGFTNPVYDTDGRTDIGFNVNAGAGMNLFHNLGIQAEFGFNNLGLSSTALAAAGVPGGSARVYSVTLNPIVRFTPESSRVGVYGIGGYGFYRRTVEFTAPTVATVTGFDPFYGVFFPAAVPATSVLASFTQNKMGWNGGAGISVQVKEDSKMKVYAEARYHHILTSPVRTTLLPVTFGLRW